MIKATQYSPEKWISAGWTTKQGRQEYQLQRAKESVCQPSTANCLGNKTKDQRISKSHQFKGPARATRRGEKMSNLGGLQEQEDLEASATAAMPETALLRRTARRETPPMRMGRPRTSVSLLRTQSSTHSCRGRSALIYLSCCCRRGRSERVNHSLTSQRGFLEGNRGREGGRNTGQAPTLEGGCGEKNAPKGSRRRRQAVDAGRIFDRSEARVRLLVLISMPPNKVQTPSANT